MYQELLAASLKQGVVTATTTEEVRHFLGPAPGAALYRCNITNIIANVVKQSNAAGHFSVIYPIRNSILIANMGAISLVEPGSVVLFWPGKERLLCLPTGNTELYFGTLNEKHFSELRIVRDHPSQHQGIHVCLEGEMTISTQRIQYQSTLSEAAQIEQIFLDALATSHQSPKSTFSPKDDIPYNDLNELRNTLNQIWNDPYYTWDLSTCSEISGFSPFHFSRLISQFTGLGLKTYVDKCRARSFAYYAVNRLPHVGQDVDRCNSNQLGVRKTLRDHTGFSAADLNYARKKLLNLGQVAKQYLP